MLNRIARPLILALAIAALLLAVVAVTALARSKATAAALPSTMSYQGHLLDDQGSPVADGPYALTFSLWDTATVGSGTLLWGPEPHAAVQTTDGYFSVILGETVSLDSSALETDTYLQIAVEGETLSPRQKLAAVPFAIHAATVPWSGVTDKPSFDAVVPDRVILMWTGAITDVPVGWGLCDGTSETPDLSGRFLVGYDSAHTSYDAIGETGGEEIHTLTVAEMPAHSHDLLWKAGATGSSMVVQRDNDETAMWLGGRVRTTGGSQPHENRPPYYTVAYIMKYPTHALGDAPDACPAAPAFVGHAYEDDNGSVADLDVYSFTVPSGEAGQSYVIETFSLASDADTYIDLLGTDCGSVITSDDDSGDEPRASKITWQSTVAGDYYVRVTQPGMTPTGATTAYSVRVRKVYP